MATIGWALLSVMGMMVVIAIINRKGEYPYLQILFTGIALALLIASVAGTILDAIEKLAK